jgi:hypothetical protein
MAIKITTGKSNKLNVTTTPKNRISINTGGGTGASAIDTITELRDVDASDLDNNETLVYDEGSGKFVVKEIPIINGGTF